MFNPNAEFKILKKIPTRETRAETEPHHVIVENKISDCKERVIQKFTNISVLPTNQIIIAYFF